MRYLPFRRGLRSAAAALLALVLVSGSWPGVCQEKSSPAPGSAKSEISIIARRKDLKDDRMYASGAVEIRYRDVTLFAESVELNLETKDVVADGNVVIQMPDEVTRADRVFFNLDTGRARIEHASGMIQPSIFYKAESIERESADRYSLRRARLTSCAQPVPRWGFSFSRANLVTGDYVEMWDTVLRIKGIPVFYLPYLRYPLEKERSTGFLMPKIGASGAKGFMFSQSFYWAMARNMDATVGVDYYLKRGLGTGLDYRYLFGNGTGGELSLYTFFFKRNPDGSRPDNAYAVRLGHNQALPLGFTLTASVDYQSSYDFLREFDNSFREASVSNRSSQVYLSRSWGAFNISARASLIDTYFSELNDGIRSVSLPLVNFNVFKLKLFSPLYFSLNASFNSWKYGWQSEYRAGTERKSTTASIQPTLSLPLTAIPWLTANTSLSGNITYYAQSFDAASGTISNNPFFTRNLAAEVDVTGPVFYRVFTDAAGRPSLKNIIEPYVNYTFESPISQASRIVTTYGFFRYHQMSYGLTSRFLFRQAEHPVEVVAFSLGQTYYFSPADGPLSQYVINGRPPRFSEATATLRLYPLSAYSLDAAVGYNPYYKNFSSVRVTATAGYKADNRFLSLSWFKSTNALLPGVTPELAGLYNRDQLNVFAGWRLTGVGLDVQGEVDYNIRDRKLLYTAGQAIYHYQCLDFLLEARVFYLLQTPDVQIRFSVGLGNIGRTLDFLGGIGF